MSGASPIPQGGGRLWGFAPNPKGRVIGGVAPKPPPTFCKKLDQKLLVRLRGSAPLKSPARGKGIMGKRRVANVL